MKNQSTFLEELSQNTLAKNKDLQNQIIPAGSLSQEDALWVYQEGYFARLHESLSENYQATRKYLGADQFQNLSFEYILSHPSKNYQINQYGLEFPNFLNQSNLPEAFQLSEFEKNGLISFTRKKK